MRKANEPGQAGLRAAVTAMFRSAQFRAAFGKDMKQVGLAALVGSAAAFFPFTGIWHPLDGGMLLIAAVVSYFLGAILTFKYGG